MEQNSREGRNERCSVRLLSDLPAREDAFEGAYQRVADAIYEIVTEQDGGKAIALIGPWGSGKSTVVNLLEERVTKNDVTDGELLIFTFDAWAHKGDPLRRSFLERLIKFFQGNRWIPDKEERKKYWDRKLKELSQRWKEQTQTSKPNLTPAGKVVAASLLLAPIGLAILTTFDISNITNRIGWIAWGAGIVFSALPLFLGIYLAVKSKQDGIFSLLIHQIVTETRTETYETPEPTSVEFEKIYKDLLKDSLENQSKRQLLIVIDNLDRMDTRTALSLISTLKPFLQANMDQRQWEKQVWYLIPFDLSGLKRLLSNPAIQESSDQKRQDRTVDDDDLAKAFLDKTFQIRLHVPLPVLSDWHRFFKEQLQKALPQIVDEYRIERIFDIFIQKQSLNPTPREIKLFINHLAAVYLQWCNHNERISMVEQALYVALREYTDWSPALGKEELPEEDKVFSLLGISGREDKEKLIVSLAALYRGVPREKAFQFLRRPIEQALTDGDQEFFKKNMNKPGLLEQLERVLDDRLPNWQSHEPQLIGKATRALVPLQQNAPWYRLREASKQVEDWSVLDEKAGQGLAQLIQTFHSDEEFISMLLSHISNSIPETEKEKERG